MKTFRYTAVKDGRKYVATVKAKNRFELYKMIRKEGGKLISVSDLEKEVFSFAYWNARLSSVPEKEKMIFANNLSAMLGAGLSVSRALEVSIKQSKNPKFKKVLSEIKSDVENGSPLHSSMARFPNIFSNLFVSMVKAGEESGNLPEALKRVSDQLQRSYKLKKKIKGAMIYPSIILTTIVGIGILMMIKVVPTLADIFQELDAELPKSTQAVIIASNFMREHLIITTLFIFGFVLFLVFLPKSKHGKKFIDYLAIHLPAIKTISQESNAAFMARTLSSLLSSGVDLISSLNITREVLQNHYHKAVLAKAAISVEKGSPLHESFEKKEHLFPALVPEIIAVGEETGSLSELLEEIASFYEEEVEQKTKDMSTIVEPFLMLLVGGAVGFFAIAMIAPIYSLGNAF